MQLDLEELIALSEGSRASLGHSPGSEKAQKMTAISGQKCCELLPMPRTDEIGSGLWLTPKASDTSKGESNETFTQRMGDRSENVAQSLPAQVNNPKTHPTTLWRTPDTGDGGTSGLLKEGKDFRENGQAVQVRLVDQVNNERLWPTPTATDYKGSGKTGELRDRLDYAVERGATKSKTYEKPVIPGSLNPEWVEWLMGFPIGHTDLKD